MVSTTAFGRGFTSASGCLTIAVYEYTHLSSASEACRILAERPRWWSPLRLDSNALPRSSHNPLWGFRHDKRHSPYRSTGGSWSIDCVWRETRRAPSHECFVPMCELLHTVSANQTCNSTILLLEQAPLALNAQRPPITGVPGAQIGGPLWGNPPALSGSGRAAARLDSEQFWSAPST